jgi:hypothetical protein
LRWEQRIFRFARGQNSADTANINKKSANSRYLPTVFVALFGLGAAASLGTS